MCGVLPRGQPWLHCNVAGKYQLEFPNQAQQNNVNYACKGLKYGHGSAQEGAQTMAASSQHHHLHHFAALDSAAPVVTREEAAKLHVTVRVVEQHH